LAPPTFHIRISPATPRRFSRSARGRGDHVVVGDHGEDLDPLLGDHPLRHLHVHVVAGVVAVKHDHAPAAVRRLMASAKLLAVGEEKSSPTATASTMLRPA
jgi:hypothetical protein